MGLLSLLLSLTISASSVGATSVREAVTEARAQGYEVCSPLVVDAAQGWDAFGYEEPMPSDVAAWAAWPEAFGVCAVGWTPDADTDPEWIARHEICHLAVGAQIDAAHDHGSYADPHHQHPSFVNCEAGNAPLDSTDTSNVFDVTLTGADATSQCGGVGEWEWSPGDGCVSLTDNGEGSLPQCPDPYNGYCNDPNAVVFDPASGATALVRDLYPEVTTHAEPENPAECWATLSDFLDAWHEAGAEPAVTSICDLTYE